MDKTNHVGGTEVRNAVAAGEFSEGYTGDTYCLGCGNVISYGETIPATHTHVLEWTYDSGMHWQVCGCGESSTAAQAHQFDDDADATCDTCGYTREVHQHSFSTATCTTPATCTCGETTGDVDKSNHVGGTEIRDAKDATEFEAGYTGDIYCLGCGDKLADGQSIPATHTHSYTAIVTAPTCKEQGYTTYTCSCNDSYVGDYVDALGHAWSDYVSDGNGKHARTCGNDSSHYQQAQCGDGADADKLCDACGYDLHVHSYNGYGYDRNGHWKVCSCGATTAAEDHDWYIYKKDANKHYWRCDCGNNGWGSNHFDNNDTGKCDDCGYQMTIIYTVTFDPNGGSGTMAPQTFTEGVEQTLTANAFTREGCVFMRWNTAENGGGQGYTDGQSITVSENLTLYALWHQHTYGGYIYTDGTGHYKECTDSGCPDENKGRTATETHNGNINSPMGCTDCHYSSIPLTVTINPTYLIGGGTISITTSKYADQVTAGSDSIEITTNDHISWTATIRNGQYAHSKFNATAGKESADSEWFDVAATFSLNPTAETLIGGGTVTLITSVPASSVVCAVDGISVHGSGDEWTAYLPNSTATYTFTATLDNYTDTCTVSVTAHAHKYTIATCTTAGVCSCGATTGVDPNNHTGGTEIRNAAEATIVADGYTGDTYCLGCGEILESGEVMPKTGLIFTGTDGEIVTFTPGEGLVLPEDAVLVVEPHTPSGDDLDFLLPPETTEPPNVTQEVSVDVADIQNRIASTFTGPGEVEYTRGELLLIDGKAYYLYPGSGSGKLQLLDMEGILYDFDGTNPPESTGTKRADFPEKDEYISINGAVYQVLYSERDKVVLYMDGKIVGEYLNYGALFLYGDDYHPDKVNERQQLSGTVTPGENPIGGLVPGKTYNVSVIGANDIFVPGYDEALLRSTAEDTMEIAAAKAELERLKADMDAKRAALDQLGSDDWAAWYEAEIAYKEALAALTGNQKATVTQTFDIPVQFVNNPNLKFAAVHVTNPYANTLEEAYQKYKDIYMEEWEANRSGASKEEIDRLHEEAAVAFAVYDEIYTLYQNWETEHAAGTGTGNEFGIVTIAEDGKTLTATYAVDGFSPFIVYAFVEADEPEIKEFVTQPD